MIANYLQAASNCIVSAPNYLVCCKNECEGLMGDIESAIAAPAGTPDDILHVVSQLSSPSSVDDKPPKLGGSLTQQLNAIANTHGGNVPLHGRLFAQWLHYVFPRECPFPHKSGEFASHTLSPQDYGGEYVATHVEMKIHAASNESFTEVHDSHEQHEWMDQWSAEEELFATNYQTQGPMEERRQKMIFATFVFVAAMLGASFGILPIPRIQMRRGNDLPFAMADSKVKFV